MAFDILQIKFLEITQICDAKLMFRLYFSHYVINIHFSLNEIGHKLDYYQKMSCFGQFMIQSAVISEM